MIYLISTPTSRLSSVIGDWQRRGYRITQDGRGRLLAESDNNGAPHHSNINVVPISKHRRQPHHHWPPHGGDI